MKKLLTLAVVAATAGLSQAATLSWSGLNIYKPGSTTEKLSGGAVYLFITEQSKNFGATPTTVTKVTELLDAGVEVVKSENKVTGIKSGTTTIDVAAAGATNTAGGFSGATGYYGNFGAGDSLKAFAVIFDAADASAASNYIVTEVKEASWTSSSGAKTLGFGSQANATWTAVPEPATATLALAGLALLLKRRRA